MTWFRGINMQGGPGPALKYQDEYKSKARKITLPAKDFAGLLSSKYAEITQFSLNGDTLRELQACQEFIDLAWPLLLKEGRCPGTDSVRNAGKADYCQDKMQELLLSKGRIKRRIDLSNFDARSKAAIAKNDMLYEKYLQKALSNAKFTVNNLVFKLLELKIFVVSGAEEILRGQGLKQEELGYRIPKKTPPETPQFQIEDQDEEKKPLRFVLQAEPQENNVTKKENGKRRISDE